MPLSGKLQMTYITTMQKPYHGYAVAIPDPAGADRYVRRNFIGTMKSQDEYLQEAIAWRDDTYQRLYGKPVPGRIFHTRKKETPTKQPGVRKITKVIKKKTKNGPPKEYRRPYIIAEVHTIPGKDYARPSGSKSRLFSIAKYGEQKAITLAKQWRDDMVEQLQG